MPKEYRCTLTVRGYELDSFGHVNHAEYVHYFEHARWEMMHEEEITLAKIQQWKRWPVIARIDLKYQRPTYIGDVLEIRTRVIEHGRATLTFEQSIWKGDIAVAHATVWSVIVNEHGKPVSAPPEVARLWSEDSDGAAS